MTTNVYCEEKYVDCPAIRERLTELRVGTLVPDSPKISIVIPAYNISAFVRETLDSVFAQRFTNFEAIIVNDGSPDTRRPLTLNAFEEFVMESTSGEQAIDALVCG